MFQEQISRIHALETELQSLQCAAQSVDRDLQQKCHGLQTQVAQLEGRCLQLDEEVRVAKTSRSLLLQRLRNQEQRAGAREQEQDSKDRLLLQRQTVAQVQGSESRLRRALAEAQQEIKNKEDLIGGLNAALVELQRARASEVMQLEAELVRLRKHVACREANVDGLDSGDTEELVATIHKQETG